MAGARPRLADRSDGRAASPTRDRPSLDVVARIDRGARLAVFGRTGSGKSTLVRQILRAYSRAVLADPKGRATIDAWPIVYGAGEFVKAWPATPRIIVRLGAGENRRKWLDAIAWHVFSVGETAFCLDDTMGVVSAHQSAPGLDAIVGQGRELGITSIVCSQRPRRIPPAIISEADHVFALTLNRRDDRDAVSEVIGDYSGPAVWHGFVYWAGHLTSAVDCRPLERVR